MPKAQWGEDAEFFGPRHDAREARILRLLGGTPPGLHLECAAGLGSLAAKLTARGFRVVAADASWKSLMVAKRLHGSVFYPVVADMCRLPFRGGVFASATSAETLEHIDDDGKALAELARVLVPGGVLAGTVPHDPQQWSSWDEWAGHRRRYTQGELAAKLSEAGFSPRVRDWGFPAVRLYDALFLRPLNRRRLELPGPADSDPPLRWVARLGRARPLVTVVGLVFRLDGLFAGSGRGVVLEFAARRLAEKA
ncbi:MAG: class I SAM-dependent methyltransferase [Thermoanaerobaculum sp.]